MVVPMVMMTAKSNVTAPLHPTPTTQSGPSVERIISAHPFLRGMDPHQLRLLSDCGMPAHFQAGEVIFREGDPANRFYLIQNGKIAQESFAQGKGHTLIQTIEAGGVLGWSWLFPPFFWHFDARALETTG